MNFDSLDDSQHKLITVRLILFESFIVCFVLYSLNCIVNSNRKFVITRTRHSRLRPTSISQECSVVCSGNKLVICFWAVPKYDHQLQVTLLTVLRDWNAFPTWTQTIQVFQPYIRNYIHYPPPPSPPINTSWSVPLWTLMYPKPCIVLLIIMNPMCCHAHAYSLRCVYVVYHDMKVFVECSWRRRWYRAWLFILWRRETLGYTGYILQPAIYPPFVLFGECKVF